MAQIRYMVDDVGQSVDFYTDILGFDLIERFGPAMAILRLGDLDLWVAGPPASARKPMPDGATPQPGGWNRFVFQVDDIDAFSERLNAAGVACRSEIVSGPGGRQLLFDDPSGNPIEAFEPA